MQIFVQPAKFDPLSNAYFCVTTVQHMHWLKCFEAVDGALTNVLDQIGVNNFAFLLHAFCVRKKLDLCELRFILAIK